MRIEVNTRLSQLTGGNVRLLYNHPGLHIRIGRRTILASLTRLKFGIKRGDVVFFGRIQTYVNP